MSHPMAPGWTQTKKLALFTNLIDTKAPSNCIRKWYLRKCFEFFMIFFNDCSSFSFEEKTIPVFLRLGPCLYSVDWATSSHCPDGRNEFRGNRNDSKTAQLIFRGLEKKTREEKAKKDPFKKTKKMEKMKLKIFTRNLKSLGNVSEDVVTVASAVVVDDDDVGLRQVLLHQQDGHKRERLRPRGCLGVLLLRVAFFDKK